MDVVTFRHPDIRVVAALVIFECTGEVPQLEIIRTPCDIQVWRRKEVRWFCIDLGDRYILIHCDRPPYNLRPWFRKWPNAWSLATAAKCEILTCETWDEHSQRIRSERNENRVARDSRSARESLE